LIGSSTIERNKNLTAEILSVNRARTEAARVGWICVEASVHLSVGLGGGNVVSGRQSHRDQHVSRGDSGGTDALTAPNALEPMTNHSSVPRSGCQLYRADECAESRLSAAVRRARTFRLGLPVA
jgi:hypothetical protein